MPSSRGSSAPTAATGRHRVHMCGLGPPVPRTPGGRPPAALGHTPPAGPRRAPLSPSCSPGTWAAGIWPCVPARGCSAPEGSPPVRTGWEVDSAGCPPPHPVPTSPHAPGAPHRRPSPLRYHLHPLTSLTCPGRAPACSSSASSICWVSFSTGETPQVRGVQTAWLGKPISLPSTCPTRRGPSPSSASSR